jgi:protein gp37
MGDKTGIQWTDATWNPVTGCTKVSAGCKHCYAERVFPRAYHGQTVDIEPPRDGKRPRRFTDVLTHRDRLDQPLRWRRPRRVFVNSMSDLFHDDVPYRFIREVFDVMRCCDGGEIAATGRTQPSHVFQVLTKRPERMLELALSRKLGFDPSSPPPNVWLGVSVESPDTLHRVDTLCQTPAALRFVSYEPALEGVDFSQHLPGIDWLIVGGESGPRARPFDVNWARDTVAQCRASGVPVFVKQLGANPWFDLADEYAAHRYELAHRAGADIDEWPADLRVQESPSIGQGCQ